MAARKQPRTVPTRKPRLPANVTVPRALVVETLQIIVTAPANQVYDLLQRWERALPGVIERTPRPE